MGTYLQILYNFVQATLQYYSYKKSKESNRKNIFQHVFWSHIRLFNIYEYQNLTHKDYGYHL